MKKRIICTVTNDLSYDQRMIRICTSLSEAGYQVLLVGRLRPNSIPLKPQAFQQKRIQCWFDKGKFFYLEYNLRLFAYLIFARYNAVCAVDLDTLLPAFICCSFRKKICIYDAHEYFTEVPEVINRPFTQKIWEWLARWIIPKLKYAYTVGNGLADLFEKRYQTAFEVIRNVPFFRPTLPEIQHQQNPKVVLYQGALNVGRGLEEAIRAMALLDGVVLWLAGEGDCSQALREQVEKEGLSGQVSFLGFVPPHELPALTSKAYLGLNLLENSGLSYYYSLANKAFDYVQASIPSLNMAFPEYEHLQKQYGIFSLLTELSPASIAAAIQELIDDENKYQALKANCLEARKVLNWETEEQKLIDFYNHIPGLEKV
jgi:glycosyltransferase involved in cell wall biosynthesis